jgi:hypothetical protein
MRRDRAWARAGRREFRPPSPDPAPHRAECILFVRVPAIVVGARHRIRNFR